MVMKIILNNIKSKIVNYSDMNGEELIINKILAIFYLMLILIQYLSFPNKLKNRNKFSYKIFHFSTISFSHSFYP